MVWTEDVSGTGHLPVLDTEEAADRRTFLKRAAYEGHVPAMLQLGASSDDPKERRYWRRQATRNGWQDQDGEG